MFRSIGGPSDSRSQKMSEATASLVANSMLHDLGKQKMAQARELDVAIKQENADIVGAHFIHDLGKQKMAEANKLTGEMNQANMDVAAGLFSGSLSKKMLDEAKDKEAKSNAAAAESIANAMASSIAKNQLKSAKEAESKAAEEQVSNLLFLFFLSCYCIILCALRFRCQESVFARSYEENGSQDSLQGRHQVWAESCCP